MTKKTKKKVKRSGQLDRQAVLAVLKEAERRVAADRDWLRDKIDDMEEFAESAEEAMICIHDAIEALSRLA